MKGAILFLFLAMIFLISGCTSNQPVCGDGFCDTDAGEYPGNCNTDCRGLIVDDSKPDSRFGVHLGSFDYSSANPHIKELGENIFIRTEVFQDAFGWKKVKDNKDSINLCNGCCDTGKSKCGCKPGDTYYCTPDSRDSLLETPKLMDFNNEGYNQLVTIYTSRYDDLPPKELVSDFPLGNEDVYRDYISFLVDSFVDKVKYWEIGNENEAPLFWIGTPEEYAELVSIASEEIRAKCSECKVGISFSLPSVSVKHGNTDKWFEELGKVCDSFDFIDAHYFSPTFIKIGDLEKWKQTCPGKEFISTETGILDIALDDRIPQAGGTIERQAMDLAKYNTLMFAEGYDKIFMYLMDTDYGMGDIFLHNGLIDEIDNSRKPAFTSFKTMINKVDHFISVERLGVGQYKYTFAKKDPVYVLWCDTGTCSYPSEITGTVTVTDYCGNTETKQTSIVREDEGAIYVEIQSD